MPDPTIEPTTVNLTNCDREPIHIPGSIQPHGILLVLDETHRILQASANIESFLGVPLDKTLGAPLAALIHPEDAADISQRLSQGPVNLHPVYLRSIRGTNLSTVFDAIVHRSKGLIFLELEMAGPDRPESHDLYRLVQTAIVELRSVPTLEALCEGIAKHVRRLTGFDRVMVYRFDADWNGCVTAEEKRDDLEPFLGLHYPASDIPQQARELYTKNWLRFIANRDYTPSPVAPALRPDTGKPLDMSFCVLRSVSPIHLEYLRNMGVGASMSLSLMSEGKLWGLIACHHYSPRQVPYDVRTGCELLSQVLSLQVAARENAEIEADVARRREAIARIVQHLEVGEGFAHSLGDHPDELISVMNARGVAILDNEQLLRIGQTPGEHDIMRIISRLNETNKTEVQAIDHVAKLLGESRLDAVAAGVLAISLTRYGRRSILWFRGEQVRTVDWAGDPAKSVSKGDGSEVRLSPRGSFALWKETVRGRSLPWTPAEIESVLELRRAMIAKTLAYAEELALHNQVLRRVTDEKEQMLDSERAARGEAERISRMKDEFVATLSHELRTPLTAIQGWAQLLRSGNKSMQDVSEGLEIIERNARAQTQMVEDLLDMSRITSGKVRLNVQAVQMLSVVEAAVSTVQIAAGAKNIQIHKFLDPMNGVTVSGDPQRLQQVIWNLLNNAVKFTPKGGRIRVELKRVASYVEIDINDTGVGIPKDFLPHVFDRFRQADASYSRKYGGLGLGLSIVRHLVEMHGGTVSAQSPGEGLGSTFTVTLPIRAIATREQADHPRHSDGSSFDNAQMDLAGVTVLVVDDEPDTRELIRRVLHESNVHVMVAGSAAEALALFIEHKFNVLISDIGMPGEDGYALIRQVRKFETTHNRPKIPAVALTAYARAEDRQRIMLAGFQVHVDKPVESAELLAVVASLAERL